MVVKMCIMYFRIVASTSGHLPHIKNTEYYIKECRQKLAQYPQQARNKFPRGRSSSHPNKTSFKIYHHVGP